MTYIVIGIDGGGSKTHAIVADEQGKTIAETVGPGSAVRPGKAEHSATVIADVVKVAPWGGRSLCDRICVEFSFDF